VNAAAPILAARTVSKSFFGNAVLRDVSIELRPGRVHALLGENGAGKSTLINLLSGALRPDGGHIEVDGKQVSSFGPSDARAAGIAVVQQELSLTGSLSIAENVGIGDFPRRYGFVDYRALAERARAALDLVGLDEPLDRPVAELSLGRRQMVEIAKALYRRPRVLILDEPTSSLSATEAGTLAALVARLSGEGLAILYISHRLNEVMAICDHVTVLKDGVRTADQPMHGIDAAGLVRLMVGRDPGDLFPSWSAGSDRRPALAVEGFSAGMMRDVSLQVRRGEVFGIGGLVGQGQEDILLGLYGAIPASARTAAVGDHRGLPRSVPEANSLGMAYVPADRKREGLHLIHSIATNLMLPAFARRPALRPRNRTDERRTTGELATRFAIRGDLDRPAQALSGGNQQKVALAKWMPHDPMILLLNDPTRGVDVETKREIYAMLRGFAANGKAVVLLSSDAQELMHVADRVLVVRAGQVAALFERDELREEAIVAAAMGAVHDGVSA
jgi:ribose transport system ATP-binding protein